MAMMRIPCLIFAVAGLVSLTADVRGDESIPADVLAAIKKATVFVKVEVEGHSFSGSGFVVKVDGGAVYVVTNHHVIEPHLVEVVAEWHTGPRVPGHAAWPLWAHRAADAHAVDSRSVRPHAASSRREP